MVPAWMAELSEEWVEPVEDEERVVEEEQKQDGDQLDFGSLVIDDVPLPSPSQASIDGANGSQLQFGTTVFHDAHFPADEQQRQNESYQAGSILFSPAKKRTSSHGLPHSFPSSPNAAPSPGQQLAMAAAAFKKDLLHDTEDSHVEGGQADPSTSIQVKPTPVNRLQSLFMQTASSASDKAAAASASPPEAAQERSSNSDAEEQHQSQATQSSEYLEEAEQASCIADQQLEDIPGPSFEVDSLHASSHNVEVNNNSNAETEKTHDPATSHVQADESQTEPSPASDSMLPHSDNAIDDESSAKPTSNNRISHLPSTEFSFRVEPKSPPKPLSSYLEGVSTTPSHSEVAEPFHESRGIATSTPSTSRLAPRHATSPSSSTSHVEASASQKGHDSNSQSAKPSPALSIFKFRQDTYTRQHLQALVAEIDGLTSPPRVASNEATYAALDISDSQFGETGDVLSTSRRGMYRQSDEYNNPSTQTFEYSYHTAHIEQDEQSSSQAPFEHILDAEEDDENGRIANTRSSKRVKLSASDFQPQAYHSQMREAPSVRQNLLSRSTTVLSPFRTRIQNRVMPRTTTPLRRRVQRAPYSASSRLQYSQKPDASTGTDERSLAARPPLRSLPPLMAPPSRYHRVIKEDNNTSSQDYQPEASLPELVETPPSQRRMSDVPSPREIGKTPAHIVQDRLLEAKALMDRIRQRTSQRQGVSSAQMLIGDTAVLVPGSNVSPQIAITPDHAESYIGNSAYRRRPVTRQGTLTRPPNPTPTAAALAHQMRGNVQVMEQMAPTPEEEDSTYIVRSESSQKEGPVAYGDATTPDEERLDTLAPLPSTIAMKEAHASTAMNRRQLSSSPLTQLQVSVGLNSPAINGLLDRPRHLQAPRQPAPSTLSQTSSDRFFTSTSSRYVSGSTAPTSLAASSIGTAKGHTPGPARGIVNITPAEAGNLLTEDVLGDMVFDDVHKRWVKLDRYLAVRAAGDTRDMRASSTGDVPALSPVEEAPGKDEETTADDPFRDLTSLDNSKARATDLTSNASGKLGNAQKHNRSGSLILPLSSSQSSAARSADDDRQTEKTSTPPHVSLAVPFLSPDVPSIPQVSSSSQSTDQRTSLAAVVPSQQASTSVSPSEVQRDVSRRSSAGIPGPPKSVLKRSDVNTYSTPLPCSKLISRISTKQIRSVSFSDGKLPGKSDSLDARQARVAGSALRNEIYSDQTNAIESKLLAEYSREVATTEDCYPNQPSSPDAYTIAAGRQIDKQMQHYDLSRNAVSRHMEHDTPTASYNSFAKPRSLRLKPRGPASLAGSAKSTTSTLAWHRKPLNANATILTECSFGVSYDRLLRVLTDVVPFEPSWKDLEHINLRERGLESVVRLKEFLPNLDEVNLSDNNIAYLTGLPASLRFLSLVNNRLGDLSSFNYLTNLETLDISGNTGVTSVRQLACLRHLRTLKVDGCGIDSIEGLENLDGLVTLSICNNSIDRLHLEHTSWARLETLEASDNNVTDLTGLETLPSLRTVNMDYNRLHELNLSSPAPSLRILKISNNSLDALDLTHMPNVRTVFADCNRIMSLSGTHRLKKLENLSLREQRQGTIDFPVKDLRDIRRLYLSYNPIPEAFPNEHFLNLTLLELSGCRLTSLPTKFAEVVPNCRVLILDNNFLPTLAPVAGAKRLRTLSAVGNRLEKVKDLLGIWLDCPELEVLDLRLNPVNLGFYASPNLAVAPPNLNLLTSEDNVALKAYKALDTQHRHTLPNEWLARRTAYRALIIEAVPCLKMLDGLKVGRTQRRRARELVERFAS